MKNLSKFMLGIYAAAYCKKHKLFSKEINTEDVNFMKKIYNDICHSLIDVRFEMFDERVYLRLVGLNVDIMSKNILYIFDTNVVSSELEEADLKGNMMKQSFNDMKDKIPFSFKRSLYKQTKLGFKSKSFDLMDITDIDFDRVYDITGIDLEEYSNTFEINVPVNGKIETYILSGTLNFNNIVTTTDPNGSFRNNDTTRKIAKYFLNLNDSTVNIKLDFDSLIGNIEFAQKAQIDEIQKKYLVSYKHIYSLFYENLEDSEDSEAIQYLKNTNEDLYNEIKDINMEDLLAYEINVSSS